ncbi:hypothetical protein [Flavobacterium sp. '19STA2R22 D10 B1']|uniref:hypothetical protein n=1 Tax=Flavobacterium aerium TaxID=3037261 RepID=UPI00278C6552|nr:hypothetical protein [Flavobacterium sp. '19STA2R22 D10 B1']
MDKNSFDYIKSPKFLGIIIALVGTYLLFPPYFYMGVYPVQASEYSWTSLDPSWVITLNYAKIEHLIWGKDIAFTYGPLSYLSTRVGWGVDKIDFILYDLFISFNFFYIFFTSYVKSSNKKLTALLIFVISFALPAYLGAGTSIVLMAFLLFWIRQSLDNNHYINYIFQIILLVLMFFVKFNTGLISFVLLLPIILYQCIFHKETRKIYIVYILILLGSIIGLSKALNVALVDYIKTGLNMISGFNEIMYLDLGLVNELFLALAFIGLTLVILLPKVYLNKQINYKGLIIIFLFTFPIYVLYKQAFVRADAGHILEFFNYCLLLIFCIKEFHIEKFRSNGKEIILILVFIALFGAKKGEVNIFNFPQKLDKSEYFISLKNYTKESAFNLFPNNNQLPESIKIKIGNSKIDIFPWNISLLFENKLNYSPRPVIQSYTAYTKYLEELNFEHYNSEKSPKYVLYEYESIENRYPLIDEAKVNLVLLNNYKCIDTFSVNKKPILLLEKKEGKQKTITFEKIKEYEADINVSLVPEEGKFYEVEVANSMSGSLQSLLTYAPEISIMINTKDGKGNGYRISKKLLESGFFSNYLIRNTLDFKDYMNQENKKPEQEVMGYVIWLTESKYFNPKIKITEYKINH